MGINSDFGDVCNRGLFGISDNFKFVPEGGRGPEKIPSDILMFGF